ncbi:MAG: protein-disulfide reductase DsbD, partial [Proteobacteria bacterium]
NSVEAALEQAKASGSLVMVDFYADWCAACKEFEKITFPDSAVAVELNKIALARIDMTKLDEKSEEYEDRYEILGLPTILFLRADGSEINGSRIEGFLNPQEFLAHLEKVRSLLLQ